MRKRAPSLFGVARAPSAVVAVDPASGAADPLYADESGETFPAATVAVHWDGLLVLGAVAAPGLLVCDVRARSDRDDMESLDETMSSRESDLVH